MRILIGCPVSPDTVSGPATVARELAAAFHAAGDRVRIVSFSPFERSLPPGPRQFFFAIRCLSLVTWAEAVLMLDPASTGPSLALLAHALKRQAVVRIGGDFLWESYLERTGEPLRLSDFYHMHGPLSPRERIIERATQFTLDHVDRVAFTTSWQRALWEGPYRIDPEKTAIVGYTIEIHDPTPAGGLVFLSAGRSMKVKNAAGLQLAWQQVARAHPEVTLDTASRPAGEYRTVLADCYAVIVPSIGEVSPNAVLEAIGYGKPFICTKDTGVYEDLKDLGLFVDTRDTAAIVEAIEALLDPGTYRRSVERIVKERQGRSWADVAHTFRALLVHP